VLLNISADRHLYGHLIISPLVRACSGFSCGQYHRPGLRNEGLTLLDQVMGILSTVKP